MTLKKDKSKEATLQDLVYHFGYDRLAAKQYARLAHAIHMLDTCSWWQCVRKYKIRKILIQTIRDIENNSDDFYWENGKMVKEKK